MSAVTLSVRNREASRTPSRDSRNRMKPNHAPPHGTHAANQLTHPLKERGAREGVADLTANHHMTPADTVRESSAEAAA